MNKPKTLMKTLAAALFAVAGLSGCVAVPYGPSPYGAEAYGPPVYSPPVVVVPAIRLGFDYGYGGRGRSRGGHGRW